VRQGGAVDVGERGRRVEEAGARAGGSLLTSGRRLAGSGLIPTGAGRRARCTRGRPNSGGGERLTGGP
jgi:hypothetical protein